MTSYKIMNIPSKKKCFELIQQMKMMSHIIDHSIMVANVAFFLCRQLKKRIPEIDIKLATSAALLHDITKTRSFDTKEPHSETGGEMLTKLGYPETGDIIRQHVILDFYDEDFHNKNFNAKNFNVKDTGAKDNGAKDIGNKDTGAKDIGNKDTGAKDISTKYNDANVSDKKINTFVSEQEIVNYSDKRVLHDKVVLLEKRLEYIRLKYGHQKGFKDRIDIVWTNTKNLEKKLFYYIDVEPEELSLHVEKIIKRENYL